MGERLHDEINLKELKEIPLIATSAIVAKRCSKCDRIVFCNDKLMEVCLLCR
ncbi:MAG: hypothetical protein ACTSQE_14680 [Candidatus Heimdallarchaeaceae archaeon]